MVGDDPHGHVVGVVVAIALAGEFLNVGDDAAQQIAVVIALHPLHDRRDTLQAHAGVDGRFGQGRHVAVGIAVELHEDQIPQFQIAVALAFADTAVVAAGHVFALVDKDLRARAAGARIAHGPEVVLFAHADEAFFGDAHLFAPDVVGFVVFAEHRNPQFVLGQAHLLGQKLPGIGDGILFEIIAEGKVAEHLEKGVMTGGLADIFQVVVFAPGANAFLRRGGAHVVPFFTSEKNILELVHARIYEQQGRIVVRDQRRGGYHLVAALLEELQKTGAYIVAGHEFGAYLSSLKY